MTLQPINSSDARFDRLLALYVDSFPPEERRDLSKLKNLTDEKNEMVFNAIVGDDGSLLGLLTWWNFMDFIYLEHFAIFPESRNGGIGGKIVRMVKDASPIPLVLEAEPADEGMAGRRANFYLRCGFHIIDKGYMQPPYERGGDPFPLWLFSTRAVDREEAEKIASVIHKRVYHDNY